jgi:hypothetical protein
MWRIQNSTWAKEEVGVPGQWAKISNLFTGIHSDGLLEFVWFNFTNVRSES